MNALNHGVVTQMFFRGKHGKDRLWFQTVFPSLKIVMAARGYVTPKYIGAPVDFLHNRESYQQIQRAGQCFSWQGPNGIPAWLPAQGAVAKPAEDVLASDLQFHFLACAKYCDNG